MRSESRFLRLGADVFLKELEFPAAYNTTSDDVYQVDPDGFAELARCDGTILASESRFPEEFLEFCLAEGVLADQDEPRPCHVMVGHNEIPSLRYLMVEITDRCNLACAHCYLGATAGIDLPTQEIERLMEEFEAMGGLRLVVSGGEPLLHPDFERVNALAADRAFRSVLVTNGTLLDEATAGALSFQEVQVSLDGMEKGHEFLRGKGSFSSALNGIDNLRRAGKSVSIATMIHVGNVDELDFLESLVRGIGAVSWTLDVPCVAGRLAGDAARLLPELAAAAGELGRAFGSQQHEPSGDYACGAHLAFVKATGMLTKCGFYEEWHGGQVADGLRQAWLRLPRMRLADLDCDCEYVPECGGGCRFRAETASGRAGPDPLKCLQFGVIDAG